MVEILNDSANSRENPTKEAIKNIFDPRYSEKEVQR